MRYVIDMHAADPAELGGKAQALHALSAADMPVPEWFCVSPSLFYASLSPRQRECLNSAAEIEVWRAVAEEIEPDLAVLSELREKLAQFCTNTTLLAVRSSALDEDGVGHSYAGQLDSYLFVPPEAVVDRIKRVWRSGFGERVASYRRAHGIDRVPPVPAVLIQRMVRAEVSGVAFGADPVDGRRDVAVVSAVYGLGSGLVSGECDADSYRVDRHGRLIDRHIVEKRLAHTLDLESLEGVRTVTVSQPKAASPALTDEQARSVAALARCTGHYFGRPQDIEWAIECGELYLLQSRPITTLAPQPDPGSSYTLWDNSNIAESYPGITMPLTFSFAVRAYEGVYREFCRLMSVPAARLRAHDHIFRNMLGLINGRIYYNLLNWYRMLALLPGFTVNRAFMEQMMGVKEKLPDDLVPGPASAELHARVVDSIYLARTMFGLVRNYWTLDRSTDCFHRNLKAALAPIEPALSDRRAEELIAYYRTLEAQLLTHWDAPLVNDFFAMVFYGVLARLTTRWCGDTNGTLQNDLISEEGGMISIEPVRRLHAMADCIRGRTATTERLANGTIADARRAVREIHELDRMYREYLERFGDRCFEELKLESTTLHEDPLPLLRAVAALASRSAAESADTSSPTRRAQAEARVAQALGRYGWRRAVFYWVLRQARRRVRERENLRFERTRVFGRVRAIFIEIGKRLYAIDMLDAPRDIFYLTLPEIIDLMDGTSCTVNIRALVRLRAEEYERYSAENPPADRLEAHGIIYQQNSLRPRQPVLATAIDGQGLKGNGCCPGKVRGRARIVTDPRGVRLRPGEILVASRTDPGWIILFPAAAGLLVEHGSLLSHSAIVAREMALPAIVGLSGVTRWLSDGDLIEMDGTSGIVTRVRAAAS